MKNKKIPPRVFFNASVILAGFASPNGGSAKLLEYTKKGKIIGLISEIVADEVIRHAEKIRIKQEKIECQISITFSQVSQAPNKFSVEKYQQIVIDHGDAHILASCQELKTDYLVTLDKKHLLILKDKIKLFQIVSPKQLIEILSKTG